MPRFSNLWFTTVFSLSYVALFAFELPLFHYYPLTGELSWHALPEDSGPSMQWYGLVAGAALAGAIAAVALRDRHIPRMAARWLFAVPLAAMLASLYLLRWFFFLS